MTTTEYASLENKARASDQEPAYLAVTALREGGYLVARDGASKFKIRKSDHAGRWRIVSLRELQRMAARA